jgi:glutamyl-Q tRNA(Asp) synthetase
MPHTSSYVGRYAPSPTGPLHFGALIAAVASYLDARAHRGVWLVRIEDVDTTRCRKEYADAILRTLETFGLHADGEVVVQSQRVSCYDNALEELRRTGHVYACDCSRREIADSAADGIDGPVYPGTCRSKKLDARNHAQRVITTRDEIEFVDRVQGHQSQVVARDIGDFVIKRRDGLFAYQLAVVVDDALQGVTHVVRGADLLDSTARQIHLLQRLGYKPPHYLHHPVAANTLGQKLSKQTLAQSVDDSGTPTDLLVAALSFLGQDTVALPRASPAELLLAATSRWDVSRIPQRRLLTL